MPGVLPASGQEDPPECSGAVAGVEGDEAKVLRGIQRSFQCGAVGLPGVPGPAPEYVDGDRGESFEGKDDH